MDSPFICQAPEVICAERMATRFGEIFRLRLFPLRISSAFPGVMISSAVVMLRPESASLILEIAVMFLPAVSVALTGFPQSLH